MAAGASMLAWTAYQFWGTTYVAQQKHDALLEEFDAGHGAAFAALTVPRFGEKFRVPILAGGHFGADPKTVHALEQGIAWYEGASRVGQTGNFVLAGHRVTHGEPFKDFPQLRKGDQVMVETAAYIYTYELAQDGTDVEVPFTTTWPLDMVPVPGGTDARPTAAKITLLTCSELFHTSTRSVVVGDLVSIHDKNTGEDTSAEDAGPTLLEPEPTESPTVAPTVAPSPETNDDADTIPADELPPPTPSPAPEANEDRVESHGNEPADVDVDSTLW